MLQYLWEGFCDLLFPPPLQCPICGKPLQRRGEVPCRNCRGQIQFLPAALCDKCGTPWAGSGKTCPECRKEPPPFVAARAGGIYSGVLRQCVHHLKYKKGLELLPYLTEILDKGCEKLPAANIDMVVPVPLHRQREWERGFNQAALLGKGIARRLNRPLITNSLLRPKATPPNSGLSRKERERSLSGAFTVRGLQVRGKTILLVDDIYTTGITCRECTLALLGKGALRVYVVTLAKVLKI